MPRFLKPTLPPSLLSGALLALRRAALLACLAASAAHASPDADEVRVRMARGDLPGALQRVDTALATAPDNAQLRFLRGVVLMDMGRDTQALASFRELSQAFPELPEPLNNIGLLQARGGQLEAARQSFQAALLLDPMHRAARNNLGQVHLMLAVQAWEQVAAAGPPDAALLRRLEGARALLSGLPR